MLLLLLLFVRSAGGRRPGSVGRREDRVVGNAFSAPEVRGRRRRLDGRSSSRGDGGK